MATKGSPKNGAKKVSGFNTEGAKETPRLLLVDLTEAEINTKSRKVTKLEVRVEELKAEIKKVCEPLTLEMKEALADIKKISKQAEDGQEERQVKCFEQKDFNRGVVKVVRCDTGKVVEDRVMGPDERQETMDVEPKALPKVARKGRGLGLLPTGPATAGGSLSEME